MVTPSRAAVAQFVMWCPRCGWEKLVTDVWWQRLAGRGWPECCGHQVACYVPGGEDATRLADGDGDECADLPTPQAKRTPRCDDEASADDRPVEI